MSPLSGTVPAVVAAGDRGAATAIYGESKVYLEIGGRPLVAHVVAVLQRVPEISEVWVVGDADRLRAVFEREDVRGDLHKPLHIVTQFQNLYENTWETYRRLLPGAGAEGRDPEPQDEDREVLYVSGDLPFATPQEISAFVRRGLEAGCSYALGVVNEAALEGFYPRARGKPGIRMAYFNLREGRLRQSNLHLVKPARIGSRRVIEEMYEHRHQREIGAIVGLAWRLLRSERASWWMLLFFGLMHVAGLVDRWGLRGLADLMRRWLPTARVEWACSSLLRASFRLVLTEAGGAAVDIDSARDYEAAKARFEEWRAAQAERAECLYGPSPLPPAPAKAREAR